MYSYPYVLVNIKCWLWWKEAPPSAGCHTVLILLPSFCSSSVSFMGLLLCLKSGHLSSSGLSYLRRLWIITFSLMLWALVLWYLSNTSDSDPGRHFPPTSTLLLTPFLSLLPLLSWTPKLEPTHFLFLRVLSIQQKQKQSEISVLLSTSVLHPQHADMWGYKVWQRENRKRSGSYYFPFWQASVEPPPPPNLTLSNHVSSDIFGRGFIQTFISS